MINLLELEVDNISNQYQIHIATSFKYGTAGFREKANILDAVVFRTGILAALRSRFHKGKAVGVMITASHNPPEDNGVKLVEPDGHMLDEEWEKYAVVLANVPDAGLNEVVQKILVECNINNMYSSMVLCARDTRESSPRLRDAVSDGANFLIAGFKSFEELTTPQFHFMVKRFNEHQNVISKTPEVDPINISSYFDRILQGYFQLVQTKCLPNHTTNGQGDTNCAQVFVDAANGVGAKHVQSLEQMLRTMNAPLSIQVHNTGPERLNIQCGADFVKIEQRFPKVGLAGKEIVLKDVVGQRWASFDGDADRIVFFYVDKDCVFHLLDGDKIATLIASFLGEQIKDANLWSNVNLGLVQTAYANGSSTNYIKDKLCLDVYCVPTGVKHLHKKAEELDVGVYFEANGHGTVTFSQTFRKLVTETSKQSEVGSKEHVALSRIEGFINLINETVGDAISDLLAVECILYLRNWSIDQWDAAYSDLPSRQLKVKVPDRGAVETTDAERVCTKPVGLQEQINKLTQSHGPANARAFVRPSGTENIVRVYAEAPTQGSADELAKNVSELVTRFCA